MSLPLANLSICFYLSPTPSPNILVGDWLGLGSLYFSGQPVPPSVCLLHFRPPVVSRDGVFSQWLEIAEPMHVVPMTDFKLF